MTIRRVNASTETPARAGHSSNSRAAHCDKHSVPDKRVPVHCLAPGKRRSNTKASCGASGVDCVSGHTKNKQAPPSHMQRLDRQWQPGAHEATNHSTTSGHASPSTPGNRQGAWPVPCSLRRTTHFPANGGSTAHRHRCSTGLSSTSTPRTHRSHRRGWESVAAWVTPWASM